MCKRGTSRFADGGACGKIIRTTPLTFTSQPVPSHGAKEHSRQVDDAPQTPKARLRDRRFR